MHLLAFSSFSFEICSCAPCHAATFASETSGKVSIRVETEILIQESNIIFVLGDVREYAKTA